MARRDLGRVRAEIRELALFLGTVLKSGDRGAIFAPNRVEWASAALAIQAAGGVMVPIYPASTAEQVGYVASHSDAKVIFVDTPALLGRLLTTWSALGAVERIVLLDDGARRGTRARVAAREGGRTCRAFEEVDASSSRCRDARAHRRRPRPRGPARLRPHDGRRLARSERGHALHERHLGQPEGRPAHAPQRRGERPRLARRATRRSSHEGDVDILWLPMSHIFGFGEMCLGNTLGWTIYLADPASVPRRACPR